MTFKEAFLNWTEVLKNVDWGFAVATFATGIIVVFSALLVLVIVFWAFGKIMGGTTKPKTEKKEVKKEVKTPNENLKLAKKVSTDGLSDEIVAAIMGAISVILAEEGNQNSFVIKSIKRTRKPSGAWRNAGILENVRPF